MEQFLRVGVITSTHGLKGEVKVFPTTEDPERFLELDRVFLGGAEGEGADASGFRELAVEQVRFFKQFVIVKFAGLDRIEQVESTLKRELYVAREDAIPLEEGEYYIADLIGLEAVTENGCRLGTLDDVLQTGANDVYVIRENGRELLVPVIDDCIVRIDLEQRKAVLRLLDGLDWV